jgi:hypothetical protein
MQYEDPYGLLDNPPLYSAIEFPRAYDLSAKDVKEAKAQQRRSHVVGYTFMRDEPVIICVTRGLEKVDGCLGLSYGSEGKTDKGFLYKHWVLLDAKLTARPAQFQQALNHELSHVLTYTYQPKEAWWLGDAEMIEKEAAAPISTAGPGT